MFPWATVFGKATNLMHTQEKLVDFADGAPVLTKVVSDTYKELGVRDPQIPVDATGAGFSGDTLEAAVRRPGSVKGDGTQSKYGLATLALVEGAIFFTVLFVGFAYEWRVGALDWVKSIRAQNDVRRKNAISPSKSSSQTSVLSA